MLEDIDVLKNLLAVTDNEVAGDWKLGLGRNVAKLMAERGNLTAGIKYSSYGSVESFYSNSFAEHIYRDADTSVKHCEIVSVYNIHDSVVEFDNEYGYPETPNTEMSFRADIECVHGYRAQVTYGVPLDEVISILTTNH